MDKLRRLLNLNGYLKLIQSKKKQIFFIIISIFILYFIHSIISLHYREKYLNSEKLFEKLSEVNKITSNSNCQKSKEDLNKKDSFELNSFLEFLDNFKYKYFLCFSTLFYAVKIENYNVYREKELTIQAIENLMEVERTQKCLLKFPNKKENKLNINICLLNDKKEENFCNYYTMLNKNCKCSYNYFNGEYELDCNTKIKVIINEYKIIKKKYLIFTKDNYDEISILNGGLLGYLFNLNLNLPTYLFFDEENNDLKNSYYLNYANNVFRLPSDVINYFMIFYSNIWYK
jgi:hypothetical protein